MKPNWIYKLFRDFFLQEPRENAIVLDNNVVSFNLRPDDEKIGGKSRCEVSRSIKEVLGAERLYQVSFRIPTSWETNDTNINVTSWHDDNNYPDTRPPLLISIQGNELVITQNTEEHWPFGKVELYRENIDKGVWNELSVQVKWHTNANAYLKITRDGVIIVDQRAKNCSGLGEYVAYMKSGLYIPDDNAEWHARHIDFRLIHASGSL